MRGRLAWGKKLSMIQLLSSQTVLASAKGKDRMPSSFSMDCWSLGAIGFGVLARYVTRSNDGL